MKKVLLTGLICSLLIGYSCDSKKKSNTESTSSNTTAEAPLPASSYFNEKDLIGTWIDQSPEAIKYQQGFTLSEGGKAKEVGTATLLYTSWKYDSNSGDLFLSGTSGGNSGIMDPFTDSLMIISLDNTKMEVKPVGGAEGYTITYKKKNQ